METQGHARFISCWLNKAWQALSITAEDLLKYVLTFQVFERVRECGLWANLLKYQQMVDVVHLSQSDQVSKPAAPL